MANVTQIFVNLPVKDLNKSIAFFTKVGFTFNPQFTDENATCMIINENIYAMLLTEQFFSTFISKEIGTPQKSAQSILALAVGSRKEVDELTENAIAAGGNQYKETQDQGFMYGRNFEDPDGHLWEVFFMDMSALPQQ